MKHLIVLVLSLLISFNAFSATFTVTQVTGDATVSGSLAWAIAQANLTTTADIISFSGIPAGTTSITGSNIPDITEELHIDGSTWPGYSATGAHLTINLVTGGFDFLNAGADGSTLDGLSITGNIANLVTVNNADNVTIADNYFQLASDGTTIVAGASAINSVQITNANNTLINDNIFQLATGSVAVNIIAGATNTDITNNNFGVGANNTANVGGDNIAINIDGAGVNEVLISGNVMGNSSTLQGLIDINTATNVDILNNKIGVLANGTTPAANTGISINLDGASNASINEVLISGNIIGSGTTAVDISNGTNIDIINNNIGILGNGTTAGAFTTDIIKVNGGASTVLIDDNVIGNTTGHGIQINGASAITITNNYIGKTRTGSAAGIVQSGITFTNSNVGQNTVSGNFISNTGNEGIWFNRTDSWGVNIQANSISCNQSAGSGLGIRIGASNPNNYQTAAPVITLNNGNTVSGTSAANARIDIFRKDPGNACANCEGEIFVASVVANGSGNWTYTHGSGWAHPNGQVTATATVTNSGLLSTSVFSTCVPVSVTASVEFYSFIVNKGVSGNHLRWTTARPENREYFIIERSDNGSTNFESIGELYPTTSTTFNFIDSKPLVGVNYYRIKQIDGSNEITYTKVIKVDDSESNNSKLVHIYPNPTQNKMVFLKWDDSLIDSSLSLKVFSSIGQLVKENNSFKGDFIDMSDQQQGTYLVVITSDTEVITKPIIVQ